MTRAWETTAFELRSEACETCHRSFEVCPDCGVRLITAHPNSDIYCKEHNIKAVKVGEHKRPSEVMGFYGHSLSSIYGCPICNKTCCPSQERLEEVYVAEEKPLNIGAYLDQGT